VVDLHFILPDHIFVVDEQFLRAFVTVDNNLPVQLQSWQHGTGPIPGVRHSRGLPFPGPGIGVRVRVRVRVKVRVRVRRTPGMADSGNGGPESAAHLVRGYERTSNYCNTTSCGHWRRCYDIISPLKKYPPEDM